MDHALPPGESPVDLPEDGGAPGLGWTVGIVLTGSLLLVAFNSHALANWADQLPVVPSTVPMIAAADDWHARAGALGLNGVVDRVGDGAARMRAAGWPGASKKPQR